MNSKRPSPKGLLALHTKAWIEIRDLLRASGVRVPLFRRMLYGWRGRMHSLTWQIQPRNVPSNDLPVAAFVCGYWRSGTTLLHGCLAKDDRWRAPTTQECMNPGQPASLGLGRVARRPMDNVLIAAGSPQEDEFGLLCLGAPSFYRILLCPRAWPQLAADMADGSDAGTWDEREKVLREFCSAMLARDSRPLLVKSPTHSFALGRLMKIAPQAKAVIVVRDWQSLWPSCMRMWEAMFRLYALGPWDQADITKLVLETYRQYSRQLRLQLANVAEDRVAAVRYEDLARFPVEVLREIYRRLGWELQDGMAEQVRELLVATRPDRLSGEKSIRPPSGLSDELARLSGEIDSAVAPFLVSPWGQSRQVSNS